MRVFLKQPHMVCNCIYNVYVVLVPWLAILFYFIELLGKYLFRIRKRTGYDTK